MWNFTGTVLTSPDLRHCLRERHCPRVLARPATAPTAATKREFPLSSVMGQLDAGNRNCCILERLETGRRCTAPLDGPMTLLNMIVEAFARPHHDIPSARILASK
jgi:hypothetical protein